jgi:hypothetical protein
MSARIAPKISSHPKVRRLNSERDPIRREARYQSSIDTLHGVAHVLVAGVGASRMRGLAYTSAILVALFGVLGHVVHASSEADGKAARIFGIKINVSISVV